jgi:hypothetical protein
MAKGRPWGGLFIGYGQWINMPVPRWSQHLYWFVTVIVVGRFPVAGAGTPGMLAKLMVC